MKILLVTANNDALPYLKSQPGLEACLFVQYSHPLKALDNMAAIDPDIIVWNADDYPRHWKIARIFCPPRSEDDPVLLFLVTEKGLGEDEEAKAQFLEIDDLAEDGFFGDSLVEILLRRVRALPPADKAPASAVQPYSLPDGPGLLLLIHPELQQLMIASIEARGQARITALFSDASDAKQFRPGLVADNAAIRIGDFSRPVTVRTLEVDAEGRVSFLILQLAEKGVDTNLQLR